MRCRRSAFASFFRATTRRLAKPGGRVIHAEHLGELLVAAALPARHVEGRRGMEDGRLVGGHHEHRAAHGEHADEPALLVELTLDLFEGRVGEACPGRQVDRGRIRGVEADDAA